MNHSGNQQPTKRPAVAQGGFVDKLTRAVTGAAVMAKLAGAYRTAEGWVTGIWDWVGRLIARRTGWAWPERAGSAVDEQVEATAEVHTERPGHRIGLAETQRAGWHLPDPPPKPHRQRAPRSSSGQKRARGEDRKRTPGKPRQGIRERLLSLLARPFPRPTAMASADAAKASRSSGRPQPRGSFEREGASSRRPESPQPRQTRKAQPTPNGFARNREPGPAAAAGATPGDSAPSQRRLRFDSRFNLNLDVDELFQRGILVPGARTDGTFCWPGGFCPVNYVADLTDPAAAWLRLWFCTIDLHTRCRRTAHQPVWLTRMPDGTWQFFHEGGASRRLILRPGAERFKFSSVPGARRAPRSSRERSQPRRKPTPAKTLAARIHIDELFAKGVLQPGELRNGVLLVQVGADIFPLRYDADLFDPANAHLWLHGTIRDKLIHQKVVLAPGGKRWWALDQGRIGVELTLHGDRFQLPRPPRFASKPPCLPPQQPAPPSGADTPGAPLQEPAAPCGTDVTSAPDRDGGDSSRPNSDPAPRRGRLRSRLAEATGTAKRLVADIFAPLWTATMRLMARLGIVGRSRPAV